MRKRAEGRFYTVQNPFQLAPFRAWARMAELPGANVLEPFAGANNLIKMLRAEGLCEKFASFDIKPADKNVRKRDTLANFPRGHEVCVTNPPWLAKNAATRLGYPFPKCAHDDLYKFALEKCLAHCGYVAAVIPESFIRAGLFLERLHSFVSLNCEMFNDTDHPACLALFAPREKTGATSPLLYVGGDKAGDYKTLAKCLPAECKNARIKFNAADGNVGLRALDDTKTASIRFCPPAELRKYKIIHSSRAVTIIKVPGKPDIDGYNKRLNELREKTSDMFLTAYRGLRKDGKYRRRLDYALAKNIIGEVQNGLPVCFAK